MTLTGKMYGLLFSDSMFRIYQIFTGTFIAIGIVACVVLVLNRLGIIHWIQWQ